MSRPTQLHVGGTAYWVLLTRDPDTMVLKDADSTPTVVVRKNGASVGDSVTVTKRSATTGIYDCEYNPAAEAEGDQFTLEESATVTGTTTASATYVSSWNFGVIAVERGMDSLGTDALSAAAVSAAAANKIADHIKRRTQASTESSSDGDTLGVGSLYGLIQQAQESNTTANAGKLTVFKTDGTTELAQRTITTDPAAEQVTGIS